MTAVIVITLVFPPLFASAGFLSFIGVTSADTASVGSVKKIENSQTLAVLEASSRLDQKSLAEDPDISIDNDRALSSESGPLGTAADVVNEPASDQISLYVVKKGDSIPGIAKMFGVTSNTIRWANDLKVGDPIKEGDVLTILPVAGVSHTIVKGDTLKSIAKKYSSDIDEIGSFNGITEDSSLVIGDTIIVPDGEVAPPPVPVVVPKKIASKPSIGKLITPANSGLPVYEGFFIRPVSGGVRTQGKHDKYAVDIGVPTGTTIRASAPGTVLIAKTGCSPRQSRCGGGYGNYVVISHVAPDGRTIQTLYAHMQSVSTAPGAVVAQGEAIGYVGMTGHTTGPHVHFEVRGAWNPGFTSGVW